MNDVVLQSPDTLTPANPAAIGVLPPITRRAGEQSSQMELRRVFPNAVELVDQLGAMGGWFAGLGMIFFLGGLGFTVIFTIGGFPGGIGIAALGYLVFLFVSILGIFFIRVDAMGYEVIPTLFNRGNRTISQFLPEGKFFSLKRADFSIATSSWECVRGEMIKVFVGAPSAMHYDYVLMLAITDTPGSNRVVRRFRVGMNQGSPGDVAALWEYLRRYMQNEAPALAPGEKPRAYETPRLPLWRMWFRMQAFLGPDTDLYSWKSGLGIVASSVGAFLAIGSFPFLLFMGFGAWLSNMLKVPMEWPAQIVADAGGPALKDTPRQTVKSDWLSGAVKATFALALGIAGWMTYLTVLASLVNGHFVNVFFH